MYQNKVDSSLNSDSKDKEGICYFLTSRLPTAQGTVNGNKVIALRDTMCTGCVIRRSLISDETLKQMIRRMCAERSEHWDKYLPALLFAVREVPQESLGFSSFELLFGGNVRGPMAILRKSWSDEVNDEQILSTYQYVIELRERLGQT